ncbi:MAG: hypothetical protein C4318_04990 [Acidimicrobiia bacterium]
MTEARIHYSNRPSRALNIPRLAAVLCRLSGLVSILMAVKPSLVPRMQLIEWVVPLSVELPARLLSLQAGIALLVLARQLQLRKHRAWQLTLGVASAGLVASTVRGFELTSVFAKLVLIGMLLAYRHEFFALPDPPSLRQAARFLSTYLTGVTAYSMSALFGYRHSLEGRLTVGNMLLSTAEGLVGSRGPLVIGRTSANEFFYFSLSGLGLVGFAVLAYLVFRPVVEGVNWGDREGEIARQIVERWGSDSLSYFSLRSDKSYFFSESGESFVAYRYINGVACISGDPIGDPRELESLLRQFMERAHRMGWKIAVLAGRESNEALYSSLGLKSFYLGDEALIDLEAFTLEGRPIRKVRQSCHRLQKRGYTFELLDAPYITENLKAEMDSVANRWRGKAPNRGFSMCLNRHFDENDSDCLVAMSRDSSGALKGFMKLVPFYGKESGYSLDQISRDPNTPNGLSEFLVAQTCIALQARGLKYLSLNFAVFSRLLSGEVPLTFWQNIQRAIVKLLNPYFQIESLYCFNKKFFPIWQPRAIFYEEGVNLVRVALSYLELEAFLRLGWVRRWIFPPLELSRS